LARDKSSAGPVPAERPALQPNAQGLAIRGRIARADVAGLSDRACDLLVATQSDVVVCDVGAVVDPDAATVDALARLQLVARRLGRRICLSHASSELQELLALMGLQRVVPLESSGLDVQPGRQSEQGKVALGVEEEADPGDLST
jgi:ABC-type transporter Mla MlaB component